MKQFQPLIQVKPQTSRFIGLGSSQFAQETIDKYNFFKTSHVPGFSLIFWKPQNQFAWKIIQNLINLNPYFSVKLALSEQKQQQIRNYVNNELISQVLSPNFTNLICWQVWQWFSSNWQEKIFQSFLHSYLKRTQFSTFHSNLGKIDRDFFVTLTVNSQKIDRETRSLQTLGNSAMTFLINNNVWQKPAEIVINSITLTKEVSKVLVKEAQNLSQQQLNTRSQEPTVSSLSLARLNFQSLTQRNINGLLLTNRTRSQQNISLTQRHSLPIRSLSSTASNNRSQKNRTTPFLQLASQQPTINRAAPPSFDNASLALPYYRASAPVTQELAKVKTQLATLQANTEQLSSQAIAAKSISTPLPTEEVNRLSEQVYQAIERKIRIEQERRGR